MKRTPAATLCFLFFLVFLVSLPAREILELPLGTEGTRAYLTRECFSETPFHITDELEFADLSSRLVRYFDESRKLEPWELFERDDFVPTEGRVAWGHQDAACWFKLDFVADVSKPKDLNLEVIITGFPLTVSPGERRTVLIYLDYPAGILSHARLFSRDAYLARSNSRIALNALLLGINLSLILYNLFIFIWTRDRVFLAFVLFLASFTFHLYLREEYITSIFPMLKDYYFTMPVLAFAVLFARYFFDTKNASSIVHLILKLFFLTAWVFWTLDAVFGIESALLQSVESLFQMVLVLFAVGLGIYMSFKTPKSGILYLASWLPLIAANIILQLEQLGLLQSDTPFLYFAVREGLYAAAAVQAVLLSITLADKINLFKKKEETARREKESLEELDRLKTNFVMNVSHEFRTPLTLISGVTDNAVSGTFGDSISRRHPCFRILKRNASRLLVLVDNLLKASHLELRKHKLHAESIDLDRYLRFLFAEFQSLADKKNIKLEYEPRVDGIPIVKADMVCLETVFLNLLSNAFKFTPRGGRIVVGLQAESAACTVRVRDTGPGVDPGKIGTIFQRFYRSGSAGAGTYEGMGIGLSLVKEAVSVLEGTVEAANHPEGGCVFTVRLPVHDGECSPRQEEFPVHAVHHLKASIGEDGFPAAGNRVPQDLPGVLVVEDNRDMQEFLRDELQESFTVYTADNGKEALQALQAGLQVSLVISDIMMPMLDGRELHRQMMKSGFDHVPVLFLTARASEEEKIETLRDGAIDYLWKPFSREELIAKAGSIIRQNSASRETYKKTLKWKLLHALDDDPEIVVARQGNEAARTVLDEQRLSKREKEAVMLLLRGLSDKEIAFELGISASTVSNTLGRVYRKMNVSGRIELIRLLALKE